MEGVKNIFANRILLASVVARIALVCSVAADEQGNWPHWRGALDETDEPRRAQHGRHPAGGEVDDMLLGDDELHLASRADFGAGFHLFLTTDGHG